MTATRVTAGAIFFSSSSHSPLTLYSVLHAAVEVECGDPEIAWFDANAGTPKKTALPHIAASCYAAGMNAVSFSALLLRSRPVRLASMLRGWLRRASA